MKIFKLIYTAFGGIYNIKIRMFADDLDRNSIHVVAILSSSRSSFIKKIVCSTLSPPPLTLFLVSIYLLYLEEEKVRRRIWKMTPPNPALYSSVSSYSSSPSLILLINISFSSSSSPPSPFSFFSLSFSSLFFVFRFHILLLLLIHNRAVSKCVLINVLGNDQ